MQLTEFINKYNGASAPAVIPEVLREDFADLAPDERYAAFVLLEQSRSEEVLRTLLGFAPPTQVTHAHFTAVVAQLKKQLPTGNITEAQLWQGRLAVRAALFALGDLRQRLLTSFLAPDAFGVSEKSLVNFEHTFTAIGRSMTAVYRDGLSTIPSAKGNAFFDSDGDFDPENRSTWKTAFDDQDFFPLYANPDVDRNKDGWNDVAGALTGMAVGERRQRGVVTATRTGERAYRIEFELGIVAAEGLDQKTRDAYLNDAFLATFAKDVAIALEQALQNGATQRTPEVLRQLRIECQVRFLPMGKKPCCRIGPDIRIANGVRSNAEIWDASVLSDPAIHVAVHEILHLVGFPDLYAEALVDAGVRDRLTTPGYAVLGKRHIMSDQELRLPPEEFLHAVAMHLDGRTIDDRRLFQYHYANRVSPPNDDRLADRSAAQNASLADAPVVQHALTEWGQRDFLKQKEYAAAETAVQNLQAKLARPMEDAERVATVIRLCTLLWQLGRSREVEQPLSQLGKRHLGDPRLIGELVQLFPPHSARGVALATRSFEAAPDSAEALWMYLVSHIGQEVDRLERKHGRAADLPPLQFVPGLEAHIKRMCSTTTVPLRFLHRMLTLLDDIGRDDVAIVILEALEKTLPPEQLARLGLAVLGGGGARIEIDALTFTPFREARSAPSLRAHVLDRLMDDPARARVTMACAQDTRTLTYLLDALMEAKRYAVAAELVRQHVVRFFPCEDDHQIRWIDRFAAVGELDVARILLFGLLDRCPHLIDRAIRLVRKGDSPGPYVAQFLARQTGAMDAGTIKAVASGAAVYFAAGQSEQGVRMLTKIAAWCRLYRAHALRDETMRGEAITELTRAFKTHRKVLPMNLAAVIKEGASRYPDAATFLLELSAAMQAMQETIDSVPLAALHPADDGASRRQH
ncbi:MAG: hypothetical protein HY543_09275 [Deltaproteobacteria bacterium]|nr:hypothetical protein [Deltaproteobacteria bacterium]